MTINKTLTVLLGGFLLQSCLSTALADKPNDMSNTHYAKVTKTLFGCTSERSYKSMTERSEDKEYLSLLLLTKTCEGLPVDTLVKFEASPSAKNKDFVMLEPYGLHTMLINLKYRAESLDEADVPDDFKRGVDSVSESCSNCLSM